MFQVGDVCTFASGAAKREYGEWTITRILPINKIVYATGDAPVFRGLNEIAMFDLDAPDKGSWTPVLVSRETIIEDWRL
jgi:hypothetical protein